MSDAGGLQFVVSSLSDCGDDARSATDLLREVFGNASFSDEHWNWKYTRNPFGRSILIAARPQNEEDAKLAGFRAFWRWQFRHHTGTVQAAQPCDTAVARKYRRKGLFSGMTRRAVEIALEDGIQVLFNNPNPESRSGYLKLGWRATGGLHWYAKPVRRMKVFGELLRWRGKNPALRWARPSEVWDGSLDDEALRLLLESCMETHKEVLWTDRSEAFYRWRYGSVSHRAYNALFLQKDGERGALLIYGTGERGNLREAQIVDFITDRSCKDSAREIVQRLIEVERPDWITFAATAGFPFLGEFRRAGFLLLPRTASLVVRDLSAPPLSLNPEALSLTLGDLDTF